MLETQTKVVWCLGILICPMLLAIYTTSIVDGGASGAFSFGHFVGASIGHFVIGSVPACIAGAVYRFRSEKHKAIFSVWTAGIVISSLLILMGTM